MKVLVVGPDLQDPGGVANYYNAVLPHLGNERIDIEYLEIGSTRGSGGKLHLLSDPVRLWRAIGRYKPDIVHLNPSLDLKSFLRDGVFALITSLRQRKILVFFRGWQKPFEDKVKGLFKLFFDQTYKRADAFIVLARDFEHALRRWGVTAPIWVGATTVNERLLDGFSAEDKNKEIEAAAPIRLLYLARLEREKGVLELADAVKNLVSDGYNISLSIAGSGSVEAELATRIEAMGECGKAISILGYVRGEEKARVFSSHHVFCFPTQYGEGMPNAVLEAMAFGMPVITCPVGGLADFFEDGKMGALIEEVDSSSIAKAIASAVENQKALATMSTFNSSYASEHFLASKSASFLRESYDQLIAGK